MTQTNFKKIKMLEALSKKRILTLCPNCPETSGIYVLTREERGFKYAYIGQAKRLLTRLAQHLVLIGKKLQHIDLSIKSHGLYGEFDEKKGDYNKTGWKIDLYNFSENLLDEMEQKFIKEYALAGYQLRNKTVGGQGEGKVAINEYRPPKGYYDGLKQGYLNAQRFVAQLFKKNLVCVCSGLNQPTKLQQRAMEKFKEFIDLENKKGKEDEYGDN